jgi:DNA-binding response OmpR family regulator
MHEVLLIEDDPHVARFVTATLRLEGYAVRAAVSGTAGLSAAREQPPHAIVLDLMLPGMGGMDVLRHLKADPGTAAVPVLIFTASATGDEEHVARSLGATAYLRKPISAGDLAAAIHRAVDRAGD